MSGAGWRRDAVRLIRRCRLLQLSFRAATQVGFDVLPIAKSRGQQGRNLVRASAPLAFDSAIMGAKDGGAKSAWQSNAGTWLAQRSFTEADSEGWT
jgi:hypothetical protein